MYTRDIRAPSSSPRARRPMPSTRSRSRGFGTSIRETRQSASSAKLFRRPRSSVYTPAYTPAAATPSCSLNHPSAPSVYTPAYTPAAATLPSSALTLPSTSSTSTSATATLPSSTLTLPSASSTSTSVVSPPTRGTSLSGGHIAGVVIGSVVVAVIFFAGWCLFQHFRKQIRGTTVNPEAERRSTAASGGSNPSILGPGMA